MPPRRRFKAFAAPFALTLLSATPCFANCTTWTPVTSCNATCTTNCYLQNNQSCSNGQGITLNNGADLDMCGHSLTCTNVDCTSKAAVSMTASGSQLVNTSTLPGTIKDFGVAVLCDNTNSRVEGIQFENSDLIRDCSKVIGNVFNNTSTVRFASSPGLNSDEVTDNIFNNAFTSVEVTGRTTKVTVSHNIVTMGAASADAVVLTNASNVVVDGNVFMGPGTPIVKSGTGTLTAANNYCDPNDPFDNEGDSNFLNDNCQSCRASGFCVDPLAPFVFP